MDINTFEKLSRARFEYCLNLMISQKHQEYSRNGDKLHNFKRAGEMDNETAEFALWGMLKKHLVSIKDIIDDLECAKLPDYKIFEEKITDSINYLVLLEALITERKEIDVTKWEKNNKEYE